MDLSAPLSIATSGLVMPITTNGGIGGACYDGNGQALYAVYDGGAFKVFRTRNGYRTLRDQNNSVDYLSTVLAVALSSVAGTQPAAAVQRIGDTVYATVSCWTADGRGGTWLYRDTGGGGVGPWVLHGPVQVTSGVVATSDGTHYGMTLFTSEILVTDSGLWCMNAPVCTSYGNASPTVLGGVYTSTDGGATWTNRLSVGWYISDIYGYTWSRNFGKIGGAWYVGGSGNVGSGQHFSSTDLITWTALGSLGTSNSGEGYSFPASDPDRIYRWAPDQDGHTSSRVLQAAAAPPETLPTWTTVADTTALPYWQGDLRSFPIMCNIGPEKAPVLIATAYGRIIGIASRAAQMPPCRQYPREDGLASSSAPRIYPLPRSRQGGYRQVGYY